MNDPASDDPADDAGVGPPGAGGSASERFDLETLWRLVEIDPPEGSEDPFVGTMLGGVRLVRVVGEGGMGRVYEGIQEQPHRSVAVKLQRAGRLRRAGAHRFLRELEILGHLSHPSLCHVYNAGFVVSGGERLPWFVMEYVADALPINRFVETHRVPLHRRVELFRDVCSGIAAAHAAGVVHRDIKAANILVGRDGLPKVIDFGVATAFRGDLHATTLTRSGHLVGTIETIAPELLDATCPGESPRSDVWSLGVVFHELLTGKSPFRPGEESIITAIERIRGFRPALATRATTPLGRDLGGIVDRAMAPAAHERQGDAAALERDLATLLARYPAEHPGWRVPSLFAPAPSVARGSRRWFWTLAAVGSTAALVPLGWRYRGGAVRPVPAPEPIAPPSRAGFVPPAFSTSPIERADFRHAVGDVDDPEADRYLVESVGIRKWYEDFGLHYRYWGPDEFGVEGRLVFRYDFVRPSRRIHLKANLSCRAQSLEEGIIGNGACALEYSKDGHVWHALTNYLEPRIYGVGILVDGLLPDDACGGESLWLRIRLLSDGPWKGSDYSVAQFLRMCDADTFSCFELDAECEPPPKPAGDGESPGDGE